MRSGRHREGRESEGTTRLEFFFVLALVYCYFVFICKTFMGAFGNSGNRFSAF